MWAMIKMPGSVLLSQFSTFSLWKFCFIENFNHVARIVYPGLVRGASGKREGKGDACKSGASSFSQLSGCPRSSRAAQRHDINKRQKRPQNHMDHSFGDIEKNRPSTIEKS